MPLFTVACRIRADLSRRDAEGIGRVYFLETVGTLAGGLLFTFLLITGMNSVETAFAVSLANGLCCLLLLHLRPWKAVFLTAAAALLLLGPVSGRVHRLSIDTQWQGRRVVHYENSVYGNTAVIEREGEYTFYANGIPAITAPNPDVTFVEEFTHLSLLHHPRPEDVLVLGGGAGGVIHELLKHPLKSIDYAELDPLILELVARFPTDLTEGELGDGRVRVRHADGRLFLRETDRRYDVILVGLSNPQDLQLNRFFTREFFSLAASRLREGGVVAFTLPGSLTYLGPELRDLNACIFNTLEDVFPSVRVTPGDGTNLFLASPSPDLFDCGVECLEERFRAADLEVKLLSPFHLRLRFDPRWSRWYAGSMTGATERRNEDFRPFGVYYSLSHWNAQFAPRFQWLIAVAGRVSLAFLAAVIVLATLPLFLLARRLREPRRAAIPLAVASTGLTGMILSLALMFTFQALYGVVFYWVGLLVTAFMAGAAAGSLVMTRFMVRVLRERAWFMTIETALLAFCLVLPLIFTGLGAAPAGAGKTALVKAMFLTLSLLAGILVGLEFPLAGKMYLGSSRSVGGTAGLLYGADLIGGWAGGIAGGVVLLPVLGLVETCLALAMLKAASLLLFAAAGQGEAGACRRTSHPRESPSPGPMRRRRAFSSLLSSPVSSKSASVRRSPTWGPASLRLAAFFPSERDPWGKA